MRNILATSKCHHNLWKELRETKILHNLLSYSEPLMFISVWQKSSIIIIIQIFTCENTDSIPAFLLSF